MENIQVKEKFNRTVLVGALTLITLKCLISQFKLPFGIINGVDLIIWSGQNKKYRYFNCPTLYAINEVQEDKNIINK
jgi:hypothetical protein